MIIKKIKITDTKSLTDALWNIITEGNGAYYSHSTSFAFTITQVRIKELIDRLIGQENKEEIK